MLCDTMSEYYNYIGVNYVSELLFKYNIRCYINLINNIVYKLFWYFKK